MRVAPEQPPDTRVGRSLRSAPQNARVRRAGSAAASRDQAIPAQVNQAQVNQELVNQELVEHPVQVNRVQANRLAQEVRNHGMGLRREQRLEPEVDLGADPVAAASRDSNAGPTDWPCNTNEIRGWRPRRYPGWHRADVINDPRLHPHNIGGV